MLGGLLATVNVATPPPDEQAAILEALFPSLAPLLRQALAMLAIVQASPAQTDRCRHEPWRNHVMSNGSRWQLTPQLMGHCRRIVVLSSSSTTARISRAFGDPAVPLCSAGAGDPQLAAQVHTPSAQVAGLRIGRHFSIRDVIKWAQRMQVRPALCLDLSRRRRMAMAE